jgi:hypothetical protein
VSSSPNCWSFKIDAHLLFSIHACQNYKFRVNGLLHNCEVHIRWYYWWIGLKQVFFGKFMIDLFVWCISLIMILIRWNKSLVSSWGCKVFVVKSLEYTQCWLPYLITNLGRSMYICCFWYMDIKVKSSSCVKYLKGTNSQTK